MAAAGRALVRPSHLPAAFWRPFFLSFEFVWRLMGFSSLSPAQAPETELERVPR